MSPRAIVRVQKVRYCVQCEDLLPHRCSRCIAHPERKPRIVEVFGVPPILATGPCGCVKLACQRPGCSGTMWRHLKADGTLGFKNHFCSRPCTRIVTAAAKTARRVTLPCSCGCGRNVTRAASNMRAKAIFFSQKCHFLHRAKKQHEARVAAAAALNDGSLQALSCDSDICRGAVRDHKRVKSGAMACTYCNRRRDDAIDRTLMSA